MTAGGDWVVMGGKGKPRKGTQQKQHHTSVGILAAPSAAAAAAAAGTAAAAEAPGALPGWDAMPAAAASGGFTYSSSNTKGGRRQQQQGSSIEQQVQKLQQQIQDTARELKQGAVYQALLAAMQQVGGGLGAQQQQQQQQWDWSQVQQLVVYGLGSVEDSKVSKHQLAMVVLLQELLPGLQQPPQLYDPAFSSLDQQLLQHMGLQVIAVNEEGRRSIAGQQTLFFLPHCEGVLCDNLLAANWSSKDLPRLAILGNSFQTYQGRWSGPPNLRPGTKRPDKLLQLVQEGVVFELPVPDHKYHVASAFNDMSLHTFPGAACRPDLFSDDRAL